MKGDRVGFYHQPDIHGGEIMETVVNYQPVIGC